MHWSDEPYVAEFGAAATMALIQRDYLRWIGSIEAASVMVRRLLPLALVLHLLLPAHVLQSLFVVSTSAEVGSQTAPKVCPCTGNVGCKCCGCDDDSETEATPAKPAADPGPHGSFQCRCKVAESLATPVVYLSVRGPAFQMLCEPQQERLLVPAERWLSPTLPIDSPPPKI